MTNEEYATWLSTEAAKTLPPRQSEAETFLEMVKANPRGLGNRPPAPPPPVWEREPEKYRGEIRNMPERERPQDRFGLAHEAVASAVSPWMMGYGLGQVGGNIYESVKDRDVPRFAENTLPLLAIFAGPGAKTANRAKLATAQEMAAKGASRDAIWNETGWFQGVDGKWRFEIDDSKSKMAWFRREGLLEDVVKHRDFYKAYPSHGDTRVSQFGGLDAFMYGGGYKDPQPRLFGLYHTRPEIATSRAVEVMRGTDELRSTMLHEMQHGVQHTENFARGENMMASARLSPTEFASIVRKERERIMANYERSWAEGNYNSSGEYVGRGNGRDWRKRIGQPMPDAVRAKLEKEAADVAERRAHDLAYQWSAGEVEARNVQKRMDMAPDERRSTPPWQTQDVPDAGQIVRFGSNGPQMSIGSAGGKPPSPEGIRAYHGSPYDFDKFDPAHIGKGEGAQAYGHGLYFADSPEVARTYRNMLTADVMTPLERRAQNWIDVSGGRRDAIEKLEAIMASDAANTSFPPSAKRLKRDRELLEYLKSDADPAKGRMYEVRLKAEPDQFLDWDKPLAQQSEAIKSAFTPLIKDSPYKAWLTNGTADNANLGSLYGALAGRTVGEAQAGKTATFSDKLREAGIPGIRYLDQGSRGKGEGTYNYVVFDPEIIEILRKYGLLGPAVAGGGYLAASGDAEAHKSPAHGMMKLGGPMPPGEAPPVMRGRLPGPLEPLPDARSGLDRYWQPIPEVQDKIRAYIRQRRDEGAPMQQILREIYGPGGRLEDFSR